MVFLRLEVDMVECVMRLPQDKVEKLAAKLDSVVGYAMGRVLMMVKCFCGGGGQMECGKVGFPVGKIGEGHWESKKNEEAKVLEEKLTGKNAKAIAAFNKYVANDSRVQQVILTLRDGLMLIRKK